MNILFQYYEMSYGLNVEMHKQVKEKISQTVCIIIEAEFSTD